MLEARDRIGGRLHTADLGGCRVDLGGSWIHHPEGNPLRRIARQVGIACRTGNLPLGALNNDRPTFAPPLPPDRAEVVRRLGVGRYEKGALRFDEPFWHEAGWSHLVLFRSEPAEPALWVFDLDAFWRVPILVCHTFHSATGQLADVLATPIGAMTSGIREAKRLLGTSEVTLG